MSAWLPLLCTILLHEAGLLMMASGMASNFVADQNSEFYGGISPLKPAVLEDITSCKGAKYLL